MTGLVALALLLLRLPRQFAIEIQSLKLLHRQSVHIKVSCYTGSLCTSRSAATRVYN